MEFVMLVWFISFLVSTVIGARKGNPIGGAFLGLFLGFVGLIIVVLSGDKNRLACEFCSEKIMKTAKICPHCHKEVK